MNTFLSVCIIRNCSIRNDTRNSVSSKYFTTNIDTYIHMHTIHNTQTHIYIHIQYIHTYIHTYTIHTHIYTYIHNTQTHHTELVRNIM